MVAIQDIAAIMTIEAIRRIKKVIALERCKVFFRYLRLLLPEFELSTFEAELFLVINDTLTNYKYCIVA